MTAIFSLLSQFSAKVNTYYRQLKAELVTLEELDSTIDQELEEARQEWLEARAYFEKVSDPQLVDYAIYSLEAAEAKYDYLLKKARGLSDCQ
ncbi:MAG: YaaL family protein [Bacillota bacterium]